MTEPTTGAVSEQFETLVLSRVPGRRGQIIAAAAEVFFSRGYEGATMRQIAMRVGFSEGALYRHFASKDELFAEVVRITAEINGDWFVQVLADTGHMAIRDRVKALMGLREQTYTSTGGQSRMQLWSEIVKHPQFVEQYREMVQPFLEQMAELCSAVDRQLGVERTEAELESRVRAWMVLVAGAPVIQPLIGLPNEQLFDDVADAIVAMMGWESVAS